MPKKKFINGFIGRHRINRKKMSMVNKNNGKYSETHIKILKNFKICSLIECELKTGRTHQIRVHLNSIGNSVVGDKIYGNKKKLTKKNDSNYYKFLILNNAYRQALHAYFIGFNHPITKKYIEFKSDLPQDFSDLLNNLLKY